jgi:hypothetical protein
MNDRQLFAGLDKKYSEKESDFKKRAFMSLKMVVVLGIDGLSKPSRDWLRYGIIASHFSKADVDANNVIYLEFYARQALKVVAILGICELCRTGLEYGLRHGLFTEDDISKKQTEFEERKYGELTDIIITHYKPKRLSFSDLNVNQRR